MFLMNEGFTIDDAGSMIFSVYVDLRDAVDRIPITSLVKACEKQFAIENHKKIRISKPSRFREFGENLIRDVGEGYSSHNVFSTERVNDPEELAKARLLDEERNRASKLVGSMVNTNTKSVTSREELSRSLTFGNNCWIFCASIQAASSEEMDRWWKTMPDEYDHITNICRPRGFASALSSMVAEQLGPQGKEDEMKHTFDGELTLKTWHKTQMLIHGPVIYVKDPYMTIANASDGWDFIALSCFIKDIKHRDQLEYRFVVLAEEDPSREFEDLVVSRAMLGAMEKRTGQSAKRSFPKIVWMKDSSDSMNKVACQADEPVAEDSEQASVRPIRKLANTPRLMPEASLDSGPIIPTSYHASALPEDYEEVTTVYGAVQALRSLVGGPFGRQGTEAASAAWLIEPCIRHLCAVFDDPISNIRVTEDNYVVVSLKFPTESRSEGKIAVGPLGTASYRIKSDRGETSSLHQEGWRLGSSIAGTLKEAGLPVRQKAANELPGISDVDGCGFVT